MTSLQGIAEWVATVGDGCDRSCRSSRRTCRVQPRDRNVLRAVDADEVRAVLGDLLTRVGAVSRCGEEPSQEARQEEREKHVHVALDGKTLRGTLSHEAADQRKMHQLALYARADWSLAEGTGDGREAE